MSIVPSQHASAIHYDSKSVPHRVKCIVHESQDFAVAACPFDSRKQFGCCAFGFDNVLICLAASWLIGLGYLVLVLFSSYCNMCVGGTLLT